MFIIGENVISNNRTLQGYVTRCASESDVKELSDLMVTVNLETYGNTFPPELLEVYCSNNFNPEILKGNLFNSDSLKQTFVIDFLKKPTEPSIIGYAVIEKKHDCPYITSPADLSPPFAFLDKLYILQCHQGCGHGNGLLEVALQYAKHVLECKSCYLTVLATNNGAIKFYQKNGFFMTGDKFMFPLIPGKQYCEDMVMAKRLI